MWDCIAERVIKEGRYIIGTGNTVRAAAAYFGISKSTVHKDVSERLKVIDCELFEKVREVRDKFVGEWRRERSIWERSSKNSGLDDGIFPQASK